MVDGLEVSLARVDGTVDADLRLEGILEGLVVVGRIEAGAVLTCRGCVEDERRRIAVDVHELFSNDPELEDDDDVYRVDDLTIDLDQMLRDGILLALPESPLFCEDIETCPRYTALLEVGHIERGGEHGDPRWAALDGLFAGSDETPQAPGSPQGKTESDPSESFEQGSS